MRTKLAIALTTLVGFGAVGSTVAIADADARGVMKPCVPGKPNCCSGIQC